jgi:hypothetical protein
VVLRVVESRGIVDGRRKTMAKRTEFTTDSTQILPYILRDSPLLPLSPNSYAFSFIPVKIRNKEQV